MARRRVLNTSSTPGRNHPGIALFFLSLREDLATGTHARGKEELKAFFETLFHAIPDFKMELTSHFVAGNWAGAEWTWSGTQSGDFPALPTTNKHGSVRGASVFELQGNKFKRCSDYWDMATYLRQAGLMPSE